MSKDKWTVVAIVKEPIAVLERFIAWYLHQGADRIHLYFDDPDDPGIALMPRFGDQVVHTRCTPAFIEELGVTDAPNFTRRQNACVMHAYKQIKEGWVAVVDGDELLFSNSGTITSVLRDVPDTDRSVMFKPLENVAYPENPEKTLFRRTMNQGEITQVFGNFAPYMCKNGGFAGHTTGKTVTRAGLDVSRAHPHWFVDQQGKRIIDTYRRVEDGFALLHFCFLDYEDWRRKLDFRVVARRDGRRDELLDLAARMIILGREFQLKRIWRNLHQINAKQDAIMREIDVMQDLNLNLDGIVQQQIYLKKAA